MGLRLPVLRSPPFPGVPVDQAAVGTARIGIAEAPSRDDPARVPALIAALLSARVGGSFWAAVAPPARILLRPTDGAMADRMAAVALRTAAPSEILALLPPKPWSDPARRALAAAGIAALTGAFDPWPSLDAAQAVHVAGGDEVGLLALLAGVRVHCHGDGAVAGRGLTDDEDTFSPRPRLTLAELVAALLIDPVRYRDPFTGDPATPEETVALLAFWRASIGANRGIAAGAGIAQWKRREISAMLWSGTAPLPFLQRATPAVAVAASTGGAIAVWPSRMPVGLDAAAERAGVPLARVEDGFIRSVGLGSACHPPLSIVLDRRGIYYDPTRPSDLEHLLATADFPPALIARAERLAGFIVHAGISKYASGRAAPAPRPESGQRRVLVAGQVEDDLSVRLGGGGVAGNLDLLRRARAAEPDAYLLFKPHPDVDAGLRAGHIADADALRIADRVVRDVAMPDLLDTVDAVHVLTSLTGFEALLRGREVVTHGAPFYAGWGLTCDLAGPLPRRTRRLTLAELVAATLILYPRYLDPVTRLPCPPEILVARLSAQRAPSATWLTRLRELQGRLRRPRRWARSAA